VAIIIILLVLLSACASVPAKRTPGLANDIAAQIGDAARPDVYRLGELEVRIYRDRDEMVKDLPEVPRLVDGLRLGNQQIKLYGYHDREKKRIYSVDDIPTLIHEFKHYLEPKWDHDAPQFTDAKSEPPALRPSSRPPLETPTTRNRVPLPKLGCVPTCLK